MILPPIHLDVARVRSASLASIALILQLAQLKLDVRDCGGVGMKKLVITNVCHVGASRTTSSSSTSVPIVILSAETVCYDCK